jgi:glycosyltransferase involved in cell wall biosynthesis
MASAKISIVTPSFNQAPFLEQTIRSIVHQNYHNLEYIVIDGGSTDGSVEIIKKFAPHIHYFISEVDTGHGNAINKGFRQSTGEIMAWLNSDDMYMPWTFRTVAEIFEQHPEIDWISGLATLWNDKGALLPVTLPPKNIFDFLDDDFEWIQQESVFWRRRLWDKAGGRVDESYKFMVDGELWTRFFRHAALWYASCFIGGYRMHKTNRAREFLQECRDEMRKAIEAMRRSLGPAELATMHADYCYLSYDHAKSVWVKQESPRKTKVLSQPDATL